MKAYCSIGIPHRCNTKQRERLTTMGAILLCDVIANSAHSHAATHGTSVKKILGPAANDTTIPSYTNLTHGFGPGKVTMHWREPLH